MAWELTGNSGTNPASDFLGTVDGQPLVIRTNNAEAMRVNVAGSGSSALEIAAQDGLAVTGFQPFITLRDANAGNRRSIVQGVDGHVVLIPDSFIGSGTAAVVVRSGSGDVEMNGNVTVAGDVILSGADCAEYFDVADSDRIQPGAVMSINEDGVLEACQTPYDKNVVGVASGGGAYRPGLLLDWQESDHPRMPIALTGKVWCLADASSQPIEVGDLLTTSSTPGHAMAAVDRRAAFGAVLGKTLTRLASGTGLVLALVGLR
jgi:hypothetical protein